MANMSSQLAIVSGAAAGIGLATLRAFVARGWDVLAIDIDGAGLAHDEIKRLPRVRTLVADLIHDDASVEACFAAIASPYEQVSLVNNVGGSRGGKVSLAALSWAASLDTFAMNLRPTLRLSQLALPLMRAARIGRIVNVSSVAGRTGSLDVAADYAGAKAALLACSRQLVSELASTNVLINTVCPGIIGTERIRQRWQNRSAGENAAVMARIPLGRLGTPEEVAEVIYFLGSPGNTYMTGAVVDVNGGLYAP